MSGCTRTITETITVMSPAVTNTPPMLVSNQRAIFTINSNGSFVFDNKGGVVESCGLVANESNALPVGLNVRVSNGECVIAGTSTSLTIRENRSSTSIRVDTATTNTQTVSYTNLLIVSVPVLVIASNGDGISQVPVNVSVEPISVSGDLSLGVYQISNNIGLGFMNNSNLIYKEDNIPFASGGTGAYNDPLLIYVDEGAEGLSFVVDFNDLSIPVSNFDSLTNGSHKEFYISFLNVNPPLFPLGVSNRSPELRVELIDDNGLEQTLFYGLGTTIGFSIRFILGEAIGTLNSRVIIRNEPIATLRIFSLAGTQRTQTLGGIFRISLLNLDKLPAEN